MIDDTIPVKNKNRHVNNNIAKALEMEVIHEEIDPLSDVSLVQVHSHEIIGLENPDLPPMEDIDRKTIEGEKQLEIMISKGLNMIGNMFDEIDEIDPKYRNRHLEIMSILYGSTLEAVKTKLNFQLSNRKQRLTEAGFIKQGKPNGNTTNNFFGTREDILQFLSKDQKPQESK
jgi:hypothetical protein